MLWSIIVGGFIGFVAGRITKKAKSMGIILRVVAGLVGASVGQALLGTWGPSLAGMALRRCSYRYCCSEFLFWKGLTIYLKKDYYSKWL